MIAHETAIELAEKAGFKASIGQTVDDKYHPDRNAIGKSVPVEWVQRFYDLAIAHSRKDAEPVAWLNPIASFSVITKAEKDSNSFQFSDEFLAGHTVPLYAHPPDADKLLQQALEAQVAMQMEAKARNCGLKICDDSIDAIRTYLEGKK